MYRVRSDYVRLGTGEAQSDDIDQKDTKPESVGQIKQFVVKSTENTQVFNDFESLRSAEREMASSGKYVSKTYYPPSGAEPTCSMVAPSGEEVRRLVYESSYKKLSRKVTFTDSPASVPQKK